MDTLAKEIHQNIEEKFSELSIVTFCDSVSIENGHHYYGREC